MTTWGKRFDVKAACRDVGGDEDLRVALLECGQRAHPLRLALVAVDGGGADAVLAQLLGQPIGTALGAREDEHLVHVLATEHVAEQVALAATVHRVDDLADGGSGGVSRGRVDRQRLMQQLLRQPPDARVERGAEEQALALRGQPFEDPLDVVDEAHVQHAIGLVQDQDLDAAEVERALPDMIEKATRRGHDDLDTGTHGPYLAIHGHAAEDRRGADGSVRTVRTDGLLHLEGELSGRHDDERTGPDLTGLTGSVERLDHGQHEGGGLAGARLSAHEHVTAGEDGGDGLCLDRGGFGVALVRDGTQGFGPKPKGIEGQGRLLTGPSRSIAGPGQGVGVSGDGRSRTRGADRRRPSRWKTSSIAQPARMHRSPRSGRGLRPAWSGRGAVARPRTDRYTGPDERTR